ncbi:hypothetical protein I215_10860 [Galbibacter marinus]|uniref:Response regulatory domain-containing protein n=1 Tax=Galbibacter marinus TaxID=555500 RepID=K2QJF9_9FLAO|nr:response regulator [Galbibacter marinus]EKF54802.1 hypothetical protein I215_10860 [Galbibacter marinus]
MTKHTCVLIEEDKMVASLMKFRLKRLDFEVHHFSNASILALGNIKADVVIIGLHSSNLNSVATLKEVRTFIGDQIPIVTILSNKRQQLVIENNNIQVEAFLSSPVDLTDLEKSIIQVVNKKVNIGIKLS